MAKKTSRSKGKASKNQVRTRESVETTAKRPEAEVSAPGDEAPAFPPKRRILAIAACTGCFVFIVMLLGWFNGLQVFKRAVLLASGAWQPSLVAGPDLSLDAAGVLCGMALAIGGALIHPSLGIAVLVFLRPWDDGYTYSGDNTYFMWAALFITAVWAVGQLLRGQRMRALVPTLLLSGFVAVAAVGIISTVRFDRTYERLLLWLVYLALFVVTANSLRDRRHFGIVLWSFAMVMTIEAIYAIMQYRHLLPYLRYQLMTDSAMRIRYFGEDAFSPELIRRFNINRAFGSTLMPNTLAGFLILTIPMTFALAVERWRRFLPMRRSAPVPPEDWLTRRYQAIASGLVAWFAATVFCFSMLYIPTAWSLTPLPWFMDPLPLAALSAALGFIPGMAVGAALDKRGAADCMLGVATLLLTAFVPVQCYALWLTYSRGGMLALFVAAGVAGAAYRCSGGTRAKALVSLMPRWMTGALVGLVLAVGMSSLSVTGSLPAAAQDTTVATPAAPTTPADPSRVLLEEGYEVTLQDLANPATFRIRLTYWRVALDVFREYFWCGAGLGNFESVYPNQQRVGDPPVRDAHNGYLQAFCETGVIGGLLLVLFWGYFAVYGGMRVLAEPETSARTVLAGVYAGVLAFGAHAFIDIHFSHPGLMMLASIMAGLFFSYASGGSGGERQSSRRLPWQVVSMMILVTVAAIFGATVRIYLKHVGISRANLVGIASTQHRDDRLEMLKFFLSASAPNVEGQAPPTKQVWLHSAREFLPSMADVAAVGTLVERRQDGSSRRLENGEVAPPNTVLVVTQIQEARTKTLAMAEIWAKDMERADARFPHDPEHALHLALWNHALAERKDIVDPLGFATKMVEWSKEAVARNPKLAELHYHQGRALWLLGQIKGSGQGKDDFIAALDAFSAARNLLPSLPIYHDIFAEFAGHVSDAFRLSEREQMTPEYQALREEYLPKAEAYAALKAEALAEAERIRAARVAMRLDPEG